MPDEGGRCVQVSPIHGLVVCFVLKRGRVVGLVEMEIECSVGGVFGGVDR